MISSSISSRAHQVSWGIKSCCPDLQSSLQTTSIYLEAHAIQDSNENRGLDHRPKMITEKNLQRPQKLVLSVPRLATSALHKHIYESMHTSVYADTF